MLRSRTRTLKEFRSASTVCPTPTGLSDLSDGNPGLPGGPGNPGLGCITPTGYPCSPTFLNSQTRICHCVVASEITRPVPRFVRASRQLRDRNKSVAEHADFPQAGPAIGIVSEK